VKVLITCRQMQACIGDFRAGFDERGIELAMPDVVQQPTEEELIGMIGDVDGMIAGDDPLTARVLGHAGRLRIISKWGVGTDGIDFEAARARGITVTNTPGVFGAEVADVAVAYMVMLARQLHRIDASVRDGGWLKVEGRSLTGRTLGIAGLGSIGRATARRGHGFGMRVIGHDIAPPEHAAGVELVDRETLFRDSDVLILCLPLTAATRRFADRGAFALMRPGSLLVNVARGPLVDEVALVEALESGRVAAAALDVFESEPLARDHPLRRFEQCVFGSHNGFNTREGVLRASERAVEHLLAGLERAA
jgi:D-3-phosphoglycerate dehydrogenase / 2-oxoglutarate reductase